jgi:outer membrane protein assembly factor BamB
VFIPPRSSRLALAVVALLVLSPLALFGFAPVPSGESAPTGNWSRFRGPNGSGVSDDKNIPVRWTARDILWKTPLPGVGHSSPILWGNRVFLQSATAAERLLVCIDAGSGKQLWAKAAPGKPGKIHPRNSLASSTPATDGERVYAIFWDGTGIGLYAYDFNGTVLWQQDLGGFKSQHGPGFSPIVHEGLVIVNDDQDGSAVLLAFDAKSGKKVWEVERKAFRSCYSTPFINPQGAFGVELVVGSTAGLTGYNPRDGKEIWRYEWNFPGMPLRTVGSPVAGDGIVFAASGDGSGLRSMIAVKLGGKGDVTKTNLLWEADRGTPYVPTPLYRDGFVYFVTDDGFAACHEAKTGKEIWRARLGSGMSASPLLIDGKIYAPGEKGDVYVFEATPAGYKSLAKNSLGETVFSSPAVSNGRLYVRGSGHLFCIGKPAK